MRDAVPPCGTTGGGGGTRTSPAAARPADPAAPDPPRRTRRRPEQTATTTFTLHAFKTTPEQHSRCVVLPDFERSDKTGTVCLNAPTGAWCSLTYYINGSVYTFFGLNAPTGAWCSLTLPGTGSSICGELASQCTYRCVVLPDKASISPDGAVELPSQCTYRCVMLPDPCPRERRYDATSRARSATGPGSTPPDRPAPGSE